jgi:hypothetical protein
MIYKRVHAHSLEVQVLSDPAKPDCWHVHILLTGADGNGFTLAGLRTSTLEHAKKLGDDIAGVSHECNEHCKDWEELPIPRAAAR